MTGNLNIGYSLLSLYKRPRDVAMEHNSSPSLIYKYFFFAWLFHDVNRGNWLERSAAWRYNHAHSHWLLTYLKRWVVLDFSAFSFAALTSLLFQGHWICIPFYVIFSIAIPVISVIVVAWLGLILMPGPGGP